MKKKIIYFINDIEGFLCRLLLILFVTLLFAQIVSRQLFGYSISWSEELSVYMFVWFVYFGASYAARLSAHNRVTFQYKLMPTWLPPILEVLTDIIWIIFNCIFIYYSYDFVFNKMNLFWKSQTLGIPMKYIYMILPLGFTLITLRIIQVNYCKFVLGQHMKDLDTQEMDELLESSIDFDGSNSNERSKEKL